MTRIHFEEERFDELVEWIESARPRWEAIGGLEFADIATTGAGEGMLVSAYNSNAAFLAAANLVEQLMGEMREFLTGDPHTHEGNTAVSLARPSISRSGQQPPH